MARKKVSFTPYVSKDYRQAIQPQDRDRLAGAEIKESEWKKPYLFDEHVESERSRDPEPLDFVGQPTGSERKYTSTRRAGNTETKGGNATTIKAPCTPKLTEVSGDWTNCACDDNCCLEVTFDCPNNVQHVDMQYGPNSGFQSDRGYNPTREIRRTKDSVTYQRCGYSKGDSPRVTADFSQSHGGGSAYGGAKQNVFLRDTKSRKPTQAGVGQYGNGMMELLLTTETQDCMGQDATCNTCEECAAPSIGYTTQQMSTSQTQTLSATAGGGDYTWAIISGAGSLSTASGPSTVYTAPSTNANCTNNPTIRLTDFCGRTADLSISVNAVGGSTAAAYCVGGCASATNCFDFGSGTVCLRNLGTCSLALLPYKVACNGTIVGSLNCQTVGCTSTNWPKTCSVEEFNTECPGECAEFLSTCCDTAVCTDGCASGEHDVRTADMLTNGCCPYQLTL